MKAQKLILAAAAGIFCFSTTTNAQATIAKVNASPNTQFGEMPSTINNADQSKASLMTAQFVSTAFPKMARHFGKQFTAGNDAKYFSVPGGILVQFAQNNNNWQVMYSDNEKFSYSVAELSENNIPQEISRMLNRYYKGYSVEHARQLTDANGNISHQLVVKQGSVYTELLVQDNELYETNTLTQR